MPGSAQSNGQDSCKKSNYPIAYMIPDDMAATKMCCMHCAGEFAEAVRSRFMEERRRRFNGKETAAWWSVHSNISSQ